MRKIVLTGLVAAAAIVVAAIVFQAGSSDGRTQPALASERTSDTRLIVSSHGKTLEREAVSFCADDNGEPALLACGLRAMAPRGPALPVHRGARVTVKLGAPAARVFWRHSRPTASGRVVELTRYAQLPAGDDPTQWRLFAPAPDSRSGRSILDVLVVYRDPVRIWLGSRLSEPYERASAEFAIPLRRHKHDSAK